VAPVKKLDRRWWVAIAAVVVVVVALVVSETVFEQTSEQCRPVVDLLAFNQAQSKQIAAHTNDSSEVPTVAEDAAYQQWADGLAQRAQAVTDPNLGGTAIRLADLASQFVAKLPEVRAAADAHTPGAPTPDVVNEMNFLNARITQETAALTDACVD
jgi:predicted PurR-regulated permease PerM